MKDHTMQEASPGKISEWNRPTEAKICDLRESLLMSLRRGLDLIRTSMALRGEILEVCCRLQETLSEVAETIADSRKHPICDKTGWDEESDRPIS
jgi:hypothetical protein